MLAYIVGAVAEPRLPSAFSIDLHRSVESRRLTTPLPALPLPLSVIPPPNLRPDSLLNDILFLNLNALLSRSKHGVVFRRAYYQQALGNSGIHTAHHPCEGRISIPLRTVEQEARTGKSPIAAHAADSQHAGSAEPPSRLLEIVRDSSSLAAIQHCPTRSVQRFAPSRASSQFRAVHGRLKEYPASNGNGNSNGDGLHLYDGAAAGSVAATAQRGLQLSPSAPSRFPFIITVIAKTDDNFAVGALDDLADMGLYRALAHRAHTRAGASRAPPPPSRTCSRTCPCALPPPRSLSLRALCACPLCTPHGAPLLAAPAASSSPRMTHSPPTGRRSACSTPSRLPPSTYPPWLPLMLALGLYAPPARSGAPGLAGRKEVPIAVIPVVQIPAIPVRVPVRVTFHVVVHGRGCEYGANPFFGAGGLLPSQ
ncbi:hypothetical protein B0H13DRAFT_2325626 [Mycena leptocephala]|nr:hypothetical protein B0H13DRAFT_2325626 [Mycena leptocephala]